MEWLVFSTWCLCAVWSCDLLRRYAKQVRSAIWIISPPTSANWKSFGIVSGWHEWIHQILWIRMHRLRHSRPQCNGRNSNFPDSAKICLNSSRTPHQLTAGSDFSSQLLAGQEASKGQSQNDNFLNDWNMLNSSTNHQYDTNMYVCKLCLEIHLHLTPKQLALMGYTNPRPYNSNHDPGS